MTPADAAETLGDWIAGAQTVVGFTGAGISTESGVPDFRSPGSPWMTHKPIPYDQFLASEAARCEGWRRKFAMDDLYAGAAPSAGHLFFADLVANGRMPAIITQNIDGLHQAAGVPPDRVIELHGNGTYALCVDCRRRYELRKVRVTFEESGRAPLCDVCGGFIKSGTISFGQSMPPEPMRRARELSESADLFVVAGSSLVVHPAASFPVLAKRAGARLVIINREPTGLDALADLVLRGDIGPLVGLISARSV